MSAPTKDERYGICRLARRARGLYRAEKQALAFIAETQTMQNGVCRKALKSGEDYGYSKRALQWGIHGKHRNGKLEFPGLLARRIVYVAGGYPKGGLAPGGQGLTPEYAINLEALMTFIPEVDDSPEPTEPPEPSKMGETRDETMGETSPEKGETKGVQAHTSSPSSSPSSSACEPAHHEKVPDDAQSSIGGAAYRDGAVSSQNDVVVGDPPSETPKPKAAGMENHVPPATGGGAPGSSIPIFPVGASEATPKFSDLIGDVERRQADRHLTNSQICDEFKFIFDRLRRDSDARDAYESTRFIGKPGHRVSNPAFDECALATMPQGIDLTWKRPLPKHQKAAAEYFRAVGRDVALAKWREFLLDGDHEVSQPLGDDPETGKSCGFETVQQDWLLYIFVKEQIECSTR